MAEVAEGEEIAKIFELKTFTMGMWKVARIERTDNEMVTNCPYRRQ
jgi:hypothetical protein